MTTLTLGLRKNFKFFLHPFLGISDHFESFETQNFLDQFFSVINDHHLSILKLRCVSLSLCLSLCPSPFCYQGHTLISDNDIKLSGYDHGGLRSTFMMSRMTLTSKSPVRNPQRPPSTPIKDRGFLTHF